MEQELKLCKEYENLTTERKCSPQIPEAHLSPHCLILSQIF
jgi:hypothetical protein